MNYDAESDNSQEINEKLTEQVQNELSGKEKFPKPSADGIARQDMTLEECAEAIEETITKPRECPHCHVLIPSNVQARVRADNWKEEIFIAVSLSNIIEKLQGVAHEVYVKRNTLMIKIRKGQQ